MAKLTPKQKKFIQEYLIDLNATQAAIRAGYSAKTANEQGAQLLANLSIKTKIQEAQQKRSERTQVNADWVLKRLAILADANLKKVAQWSDNSLKINDSNKLTDDEAYTIKKLKTKSKILISDEDETKQVLETTVEIEQKDCIKSLELIAKHLGMLEPKPQGQEVEPTTADEREAMSYDDKLAKIKRIAGKG